MRTLSYMRGLLLGLVALVAACGAAEPENDAELYAEAGCDLREVPCTCTVSRCRCWIDEPGVPENSVSQDECASVGGTCEALPTGEHECVIFPVTPSSSAAPPAQ